MSAVLTTNRLGWLELPSDVACPTWCTLAHGHSYEDARLGDGPARDHEVAVQVGTVHVSLSQRESAEGAAGPVALHPPQLVLIGRGRTALEVDADAHEMRALARLLLHLADDVLPKITPA